MASDDERPELLALDQLEEMLQKVANELAEWRRRALAAEQELDVAHGVSAGPSAVVTSGPEVSQLTEQNRRLLERAAVARERVGDLVQRLTFLEQQVGDGGNG